MTRTPRLPAFRRFGRSLFLSFVLSVMAFGPGGARASARVDSLAPVPEVRLTLVESWPSETTLDHPDIPDAADVWVDLVRHAQQKLDFAEFYVSDDPAGGGRLKEVVTALLDAARRGVRIRFLIDNNFYKTYPDLPDSLGRQPNITLRRLDTKAYSTGIQHAKYFLVDSTTVYLGSQNFDWRALTEIQELGVVLQGGEAAAAYQAVFDLDWQIAEMLPPGKTAPKAARGQVYDLVEQFSARLPGFVDDLPLVTNTGGHGRFSPTISPGWARPLPYPEEERIVRALDAARDSIAVQVLAYSTVGRDSTRYAVLDDALRRAAARGVQVRLIVSEWSKSKPKVDILKSLARVPNIQVAFMDIPQASTGFVPFSRTVHAKYLTVDGRVFWLGTSNWEKDYFHDSRNVGLIGEEPTLARRLAAFFNDNWNSKYAERVDPDREYVPIRVAK